METETLSLLDWLKTKFVQPHVQRLVRFGLAGVAALWGGYQLLSGEASTGAYFFLGLAFGLVLWGLSVRGEATSDPAMPELALGPAKTPGAWIQPAEGARPKLPTRASLQSIPWRALRLPGAILLAVVGQSILTYQRDNVLFGLVYYACALAALAWLVRRDDLLGPERSGEPSPSEPTLEVTWVTLGLAFVAGASTVAWRFWPGSPVWLVWSAAIFGLAALINLCVIPALAARRLTYLALAVVAGLAAFFLAGNNQFRPSGVLAWIVSLLAWLAAVWDGPMSVDYWRERALALWRTESISIRLTRTLLLLIAVLAAGAYFRFAQLDAIPPEMTSDHVEKLMDVNDVMTIKPYVFLERNTGREPLQFYFAALLIRWFDTGLTHLTLKLIGAIAGLLLLPFVYLIGKEVEDESFGLLAAALTAISFWATAISRVGLRFPLTPLFVAPTLFFLLRGLRRGSRNDFVLAGLFLGVGLNGYSTIRVLPLLIVAVVIWFAAWPSARALRHQWLTHTVLLSLTALIPFIPLARYATEPDNIFWYRSLSRLAETEGAIQGSPLAIFFQNQWKGLLMFNWQGDQVWVNAISGLPTLDFISGALFILGLAFVIARLLVRRDRVAGVLLMALPILMLPSTLSLAFPEENPSVVRVSGVIPVVYVIAAYPVWLLFKRLRAQLPSRAGQWVSWGTIGVLLVATASVNRNLYFFQYPPQYAHAAQNASELGRVLRDFVDSVGGTFDTVAVRPFPFWVDTRAVGMYADNFGWDAAIQREDLGRMQGDPRPKLFILHRDDRETISELRSLYPTGQLSLYHSSVPDHDFLMYFVPGTLNLDENSLPPPP